MTLLDYIISLCRLDHRIGGCACFDSGRGTCSRWILPLQEKKLKLSENGVIVQSALNDCAANISIKRYICYF